MEIKNTAGKYFSLAQYVKQQGYPFAKVVGYRFDDSDPSTYNFTTDANLGYTLNKAFSSLERWPYMPSDARSQILLKIPADDEVATYPTDVQYTSSAYGAKTFDPGVPTNTTQSHFKDLYH